MKKIAFVMVLIFYPAAILSDIIYMNNHDMIFKYLYWAFMALGGVFIFIFSTINMRQAKNKEQ